MEYRSLDTVPRKILQPAHKHHNCPPGLAQKKAPPTGQGLLSVAKGSVVQLGHPERSQPTVNRALSGLVVFGILATCRRGRPTMPASGQGRPRALLWPARLCIKPAAFVAEPKELTPADPVTLRTGRAPRRKRRASTHTISEGSHCRVSGCAWWWSGAAGCGDTWSPR